MIRKMQHMIHNSSIKSASGVISEILAMWGNFFFFYDGDVSTIFNASMKGSVVLNMLQVCRNTCFIPLMTLTVDLVTTEQHIVQ